MKVNMQQQIHQYREIIATHENMNKTYAHSKRAQQTLNQLGNSQVRKVPETLCPLTVLYAAGILSNVYLGKNTPEKMPINEMNSADFPLQTAVQHAISVVYQTLMESAATFYLYDPSNLSWCGCRLTLCPSKSILVQAALCGFDVLRKVAETLQHPTTDMTRESQILTYYARNRPCPTDEEVKKVTEITDDIDRIISQMVDLFPPFTEI